MEQIVDIAQDGRHISKSRGFLLVEAEGAEVGRVPLDRIGAVLLHGHGTTWTASVMADLASRGIPTVICGRDHAPAALLWPMQGHHAQGGRMRAQIAAPAPLAKRAWKRIVQAKIDMQAAALRAIGEPDAPVAILRRAVRSGDPDNIEAQAAQRYWPLFMGKNFRRNRKAGDVNGLLNYGYTVLRAGVSRAIAGAGLHPSLGLHHGSRHNAFPLADDLMEPFRPLVDLAARRIEADVGPEVSPEAKRRLGRILAFDLVLAGETTPVSLVLSRFAASLARSFEDGKVSLTLPEVPPPLVLRSLGAELEKTAME